MLVNKIHFWPKMQWMICTMLHFVRSVSLHIWRVEWYVCYGPLWFSKPTISATVVTFLVRVCFSLPVSSLVSVLHVSQMSINNISRLSLLHFASKMLPASSESCIFLNRYKFLIRALSPLLNRTLHHRYIVNALKMIIYYNIVCFFTNVRNVCESIHLIFVKKLIIIVSENKFLYMYHSDFGHFWKFMFYIVV